MEQILDVQTIQPKAVPTSLVIPKTRSIPIMAAGYVPKPLLVKAKVKLPTTNVISMVPKGMLDVSGKAKRAQ